MDTADGIDLAIGVTDAGNFTTITSLKLVADASGISCCVNPTSRRRNAQADN